MYSVLCRDIRNFAALVVSEFNCDETHQADVVFLTKKRKRKKKKMIKLK